MYRLKISAFAGMTEKGVFSPFTRLARLLSCWRLINMPLSYSIDEIFNLEKIDAPYQRIFELAVPFLKTRLNLPHTYIVYQYAQLLLEAEGGSREIAIPACILHDVGWSTIPEDQQIKAYGPNMTDPEAKRKHEVEGASIARRILSQAGWNGALVEKIAEIIDGHDTTTNARSLEDAVTKDSDKLFRLSACGIRIDCERFHADPKEYWPTLLKRSSNWFLTSTGKELAAHEACQRELEFGEQQKRSS
jgi:HD superfamily phosphodiesterase